MLSMRTIRATLWTRWQSTTRSAMASWCCRHYKACMFPFFLGSSPPCVVDMSDNHRLATLPEEEGVDGLLKLSDPPILAGRVACISLFTTGSGLLSLAASTPGSPLGDSPITFGWNRKLYRYSVPASPRYSVPPTPIS